MGFDLPCLFVCLFFSTFLWWFGFAFLMCNSKQQLLLVSCVTSMLTKIHYHVVPAGMTAVRSGLAEVWLIIMTEEGLFQLSHRFIKIQLQVIIFSSPLKILTLKAMNVKKHFQAYGTFCTYSQIKRNLS